MPPATIAAILPRRSAFIRKNAGQDSTEQVLAANVDAASCSPASTTTSAFAASSDT